MDVMSNSVRHSFICNTAVIIIVFLTADVIIIVILTAGIIIFGCNNHCVLTATVIIIVF